jgi:hypothetical protein
LFSQVANRAVIFGTEVLLQARRPPSPGDRPPRDGHDDQYQHCDENPYPLGHFVDLLVNERSSRALADGNVNL